MLWERGHRRERATARAANEAAITEWAGRGFTPPSDVLDAKRDAIATQLMEAENTLSREMAIKQAEMEVENMRFTIEKGAAYVQVLAEIHSQRVQRTFAVAQCTFQSGIDLFNAKVSLYQTQLQVYQAEAAVFTELLKASLARPEIYKAELEGQKIIGELNMQRVEVYKAQLRGVLAAVDVYKARVEGIRAQVDAYKSANDATIRQQELLLSISNCDSVDP